MQVRLHGSRGVSSVATDPPGTPVAPCIIIIIIIRKGEDRRKKKREVLHLFRCYTHTPGRSRVNPERQEEEKSGHRRRAKGQNSAGGEGNRRTSKTNLHGETDLTKTERTPKPHDTLRRGTRGELGTSWWQTRETKTISLKTELSP